MPPQLRTVPSAARCARVCKHETRPPSSLAVRYSCVKCSVLACMHRQACRHVVPATICRVHWQIAPVSKHADGSLSSLTRPALLPRLASPARCMSSAPRGALPCCSACAAANHVSMSAWPALRRRQSAAPPPRVSIPASSAASTPTAASPSPLPRRRPPPAPPGT